VDTVLQKAGISCPAEQLLGSREISVPNTISCKVYRPALYCVSDPKVLSSGM
jgi:hypothetical protein